MSCLRAFSIITVKVGEPVASFFSSSPSKTGLVEATLWMLPHFALVVTTSAPLKITSPLTSCAGCRSPTS